MNQNKTKQTEVHKLHLSAKLSLCFMMFKFSCHVKHEIYKHKYVPKKVYVYFM